MPNATSAMKPAVTKPLGPDLVAESSKSAPAPSHALAHAMPEEDLKVGDHRAWSWICPHCAHSLTKQKDHYIPPSI